MDTEKCPICGNNSATIHNQDGGLRIFVECPACGSYEYDVTRTKFIETYKNELPIYLFYTKNNKAITDNEDPRAYKLIDLSDYYEKIKLQHPRACNIDEETLKNFYPIEISNKIDMILLNIAKNSKYIGDYASYIKEELNSLFFVKRYDNINEFSKQQQYQQVNSLISYMIDNGYIKDKGFNSNKYNIELTPEGWKRVDKIQKNRIYNNDIFVSMSFADETKNTREAIRNGIESAGFSAEFLDEITHNKQIVPEMFRLIRESKMLILDISIPNYGAYYEAGYALGLGKEVIICCERSVFEGKYKVNGKEISESEKIKFGRYLKPHFDIAQKQILLWDNNEDLTRKLAEWIKALS